MNLSREELVDEVNYLKDALEQMFEEVMEGKYDLNMAFESSDQCREMLDDAIRDLEKYDE